MKTSYFFPFMPQTVVIVLEQTVLQPWTLSLCTTKKKLNQIKLSQEHLELLKKTHKYNLLYLCLCIFAGRLKVKNNDLDFEKK